MNTCRSPQCLLSMIQMKSPLSDPVRQGVEREEELQKKGRGAEKKTCICAPTSHSGSFRCHLHRLIAPKLSSNEKASVNLGYDSSRVSEKGHRLLQLRAAASCKWP